MCFFVFFKQNWSLHTIRVLVDLVAVLFSDTYSWIRARNLSYGEKKSFNIRDGIILERSLIIHSLAPRHAGWTLRIDRFKFAGGLNLVGFNGVRMWAKPGSTLLADYTFVVSRAISIYVYRDMKTSKWAVGCSILNENDCKQ